MKKLDIYKKTFLAVSIVIVIIGMVFVSCSKNEIAKEQKNVFIKLFGSTGQNIGVDAKQTSDGGYVVFGTYSKLNENTKMYLVKTDQLGNELWNKRFESSNSMTSSKFQETNNGYILLGTITKSNQTDIYLVRILANGDTLWTKTIDKSIEDVGNNVIVTTDGDYLISGYIKTTTNLKDPFWTLISADGVVKWEKTLSFNGDNWVEDAIQTSDGYILVGSTNDTKTKGASDILVIKIKKDGSYLNSVNIDDKASGNEKGKKIIALSDGSFICLGNSIPSGKTSSEILMFHLKIDNSKETIIFQKSIKKEGESIEMQGVTVGEGNKYWLATTITKANGNLDMNITQTDSTGIELWSNTIEATGNQSCKSIHKTADGSALIVGTNEISGNSMITLLKVNKNGKLQ